LVRTLFILGLCILCTGCIVPGGMDSSSGDALLPFLVNGLFSSGYMVAHVVLGIFAAVLIYRDAARLPRLFLGTQPWWWAIAAIFLGPVWVLLVYWVIHHSSISNRLDPDSNESV
jgi:hypothetical protein